MTGRHGTRRKNRGVTLIELITVTAIIGTLAAIAIPGYRSYVLRANHTDAKAALLSTAGALERCFTRFNSYRADEGCTVTLPQTVSANTYRIDFDGAPTIDTFKLQAIPINAQAKDTSCGTFKLDSANVKTIMGTKPVQDCWGK